ncbi:XRE family transcriptional regulator [Roseomonas nepalensis]|uniref:XRE family transcriptional regulator n=1 Tax=Muricoccus nepalensis TaxID=1854500 RepID=A0A502FSF0_9PROT|nr:helix-turn-helix transcriptional regulator [Roseomonas nepalensis]TPG52448.1 XRE family transcriptional regulator [Roseomonas nepalensis]
MRLERSKEWWLARARQEGDAAVGAGLLAANPAVEQHGLEAQPAPAEETRIAFGRFVNLMRRRRGYSVEQLAEAACLEASELLVIEEDRHYVPQLRTVFELARTFEVPQQRLLQLAGLAVANDDGLRKEAVRFAARSESMQRLTSEESSALEAFVAVLSEQGPKRAR